MARNSDWSRAVSSGARPFLLEMRVRLILSVLLVLATACSGNDAEGRGGLSRAEADELNDAAAVLDAQQAEAEAALDRR